MWHDTFKLNYHGLPIAACRISRQAGALNETVIALHNHKEFELLCVKSGQMRFTIGSATFTAHAGSLILVNPYALHSISVDGQLSFDTDCLTFDLSLIEDEDFIRLLEEGRCTAPPLIDETSPQYTMLFHCFEQAMLVCDEDAPYRSMLLRGSLLQFFGILRKYDLLVYQNCDAKTNRFCRGVFDFIQAHYVQDITSNDVAKTLGYTQSYFCRLFKQQFGQNFQNYLLMYRISKAKQLFDEENPSVAQAAERVGFHNMSYFARVFEQYTGYLPSAYQKARSQSQQAHP